MKTQNTFTFDFTTKTIIGTKSALKRASVYGSDEYKELTKMMSAQPTFTVAEKILNKKVSSKVSYKGMTLKKMEDYIATQPNAEENLIKFAAIQKVAEARNALYPLSKKWFLATFPNYKEGIVIEEEESSVEAAAAAELDALIAVA